MVDFSGAAHFGYTTPKKKAMGGVVSKIHRPVVIDLTKDDDDAPQTQQRPLPHFIDLFRNKDVSAHAVGISFGTPSLRAPAFESPLTALEKALDLPGTYPESAINELNDQTDVRDAYWREVKTLTDVNSQIETSTRFKPVFGAVTPLTAATPLDLPGQSPQSAINQPADQTYVPDVYWRKARSLVNATSQVEPFQSPFGRLPKPSQRTLPSSAEIINLISPEDSPEPEDSGAPTLPGLDLEPCGVVQPIWPSLPHRAEGEYTPLPQSVTPEAPDERKTRRLVKFSRRKARELLLRQGSKDNPILVLDNAVPIPKPALAGLASATSTQMRAPTCTGQTVASRDTLVFFSDGSAINDRWAGSGVAFWQNGHWTGKAFALGHVFRGSYEAEAHAIGEAFKLAAAMITPCHRVVEVCTDHMGLVECFQNTQQIRATDHCAQKVVNMGFQLAQMGVEVKLTWVKGHDVHAGNQMADRLARYGAERSAYHGGSSDSALGEVEVNRDTLLEFSTNSEHSAGLMLGTVKIRAAARKKRIAQRKGERSERLARRQGEKDDRRARKLDLRSQRRNQRYFLRSHDTV